MNEESFEDRLNKWTLGELMIERTKKYIYNERKLIRIETRIAELKYGNEGDPTLIEADEDEIVRILHPVIVKNSYKLYLDGYLREAVLNSVTAVFDLIRARCAADKDGDALIGEVFSLANPRLILSEIETESGQNDQKGFMQLYKGAYQGIRNPKAHSLTHNLNRVKALQYLVFASLLARRVEEAHEPVALKNGTAQSATP